MRLLVLTLALLSLSLIPVQAAEKRQAEYGKVYPFKQNYICFGRWTRMKFQTPDRHGASINRSGYKCVDDKKIRRRMVESRARGEG